MSHIVPLKGIYRKKKQIRIDNSGAELFYNPLYRDPSLVAYYRMEGNSNDSKGSNNGTDTSVTYGVGKFDQCGIYNGSAYTSLGTGASLGITGNAITIATWVNGNQGANTIGRIFWRLGGTGNYGYQLSTTGNTYSPNNAWLISLVGTGGGTDFAFGTAGQQNDNLWHFVVATYDGTNIKGYVDGQLSATSGTLANRLTNANTLTAYIGASDGLTNKFTGKIDDVAIFSRALSASEIQDLYRRSQPLFDYQAQVNTSDITNGIDSNFTPTSSTKGYWKLNGGLGDDSGNGYTLTNTNGSFTDGKFGQALSLNGTNAYASVISTDANLNPTGSFTVGAWFNLNNLPTNAGAILSNIVTDSNTYGGLYQIRVDSVANGSVLKGISWASGGSFLEVSSTVVPTINQWHLGIFVKAADNDWKLYYDGSLVASSTSSRTLSTTGKTGFRLGANEGGVGTTTPNGGFFPGKVDEGFIESRAWSATEISDYYTRSKSIFNETGLVASYHFNEGSGTTAKDSSPNKNDGTITNGTYVPGQFGTALSFNGSSSKVVLDTGLISNTPGLTMEAWVTTNALGAYRAILSKTNDTNYSQFIRMTDTNKFNTSITAAVEKNISGTTTIVAGQLYYVVATYDGSVVKLYVNGVLENTSTSTSGNIATHSEAPAIGFSGTNHSYWSGTIDNTRIYSRALTPQEILDRYNASIRPDYLDLRFMDGQNKLKHWIEQDGKAWVKVPQIPANSSKTIDMYYGNYSALDVQDKDGLVAYYPLDGNSKDSAGGNHGTDTSVTYGAGKFGQAGSFNGSTSKISLGTTGLPTGAGTRTMNVWVNPTTLPSSGSGYCALSYGAASNNDLVGVGIVNLSTVNYIRFIIYGFDYDIANTLSTSAWTMLTMVYDGTTAYIYKDGSLLGSTAKTISSTATNAWIGSVSGTSNFFNGLLDGARIYNRALSADEIKSLYNQGLTTTISEKPEAVKGFVGKLVRFIATAQQNVSNFFIFFR